MHIGLDSCRKGWFTVLLRPDGSWKFEIVPDARGVWWTYGDNADLILIDIPIGLLEGGQQERQCDVEARRVLGERRGTITPVPVRRAVYALDYESASRLNEQMSGARLSRATWLMMPQIREIDLLLRHNRDAIGRLRSAHPEVCYWSLAGHAMQHGERSEEGFEERLSALERALPHARVIVDDALASFSRGDVMAHEILDALALAITAAAGGDKLSRFPAIPESDLEGIPMELVYTTAYSGELTRPARPTLTRLHHAQITIPTAAEEQGRYFYCTVLGLQEIEKPTSLRGRGGFWLALGDIQIHVGVEDGVQRGATKSHLAYQVDDLAYWRLRLEQHGITIGESIPIPGYDRLEFRDPFGNRVELIQPSGTQ